MIFGRGALSMWWGCLGQAGGGGVQGRGWRRVGLAGISPKGIRLIKKVKSASHSIHSVSTLTRHHWWWWHQWCRSGPGGTNGGGDIVGVCRDPVAPMVMWWHCWCLSGPDGTNGDVVTLLVFVGTRWHQWCCGDIVGVCRDPVAPMVLWWHCWCLSWPMVVVTLSMRALSGSFDLDAEPVYLWEKYSTPHPHIVSSKRFPPPTPSSKHPHHAKGCRGITQRVGVSGDCHGH